MGEAEKAKSGAPSPKSAPKPAAASAAGTTGKRLALPEALVEELKDIWPALGSLAEDVMPAEADASSSPLLATAGGCLVILLAIVIQLELFGLLSRKQLLPAAFSRKLTHIGAGTAMTTALVLFPLDVLKTRFVSFCSYH